MTIVCESFEFANSRRDKTALMPAVRASSTVRLIRPVAIAALCHNDDLRFGVVVSGLLFLRDCLNDCLESTFLFGRMPIRTGSRDNNFTQDSGELTGV